MPRAAFRLYDKYVSSVAWMMRCVHAADADAGDTSGARARNQAGLRGVSVGQEVWKQGPMQCGETEEAVGHVCGRGYGHRGVQPCRAVMQHAAGCATARATRVHAGVYAEASGCPTQARTSQTAV